MSTEREPKLIVGWYVDNIIPEDLGLKTSFDVIEYLELEHDMFYIENEDIIGFALEKSCINLSLSSASMLQQKAREFQKITGVEAMLCSCIFSY